MQWGRFPKLPLVIPTGPTRISIPSFSAPPRAERAATGARANDRQIDRIAVVVVRHPLGRNLAAMDVEQESGVVVRRPQCAAGERAQRVRIEPSVEPHSSPASWTSGTGSAP